MDCRGQVGGGYTGGGMVGEYFSNATLTGSPAFVRREVRLDFDWNSVLPVGGAVEEPYQSFPLDNFSVRYTGAVIAAFSETYTFKTVADDGVRLYIRPAGGGGWTTLIDQWTTPGTNTAAYTLTKGSRYDVRVEYVELTGSAKLRLLWSGASTPEEVIDPVMLQGFNVTFWSYGYADLVKGGNRNTWDPFSGKPAVTMDTNGWPQSDAMFYFMESLGQGLDLDPLAAGTINYSFNGSGVVTIAGNADQATLTQSYNAASNLTTGTFQTQTTGQGNMLFKVKTTDRDGITPARSNGFTNLKLLISRTPGGTNPYPADAIFTDQFRAAMTNFTVLRVDLGNAGQESAWSDRTLPSWFNQSASLTTGGRSLTNYFPIYPATFPNGPALEHKIMLCNESGRDLFLNLPVLATGWSAADTNAYVNKVARLIRYGSDGVEPYAAPVSNPVYPPLNPNLRVYLEFGNEVWNFSYRQYGDITRMVRSDADAYLFGTNLVSVTRSNDFPILNYDNLSTSKGTDYASIDTWRKRKWLLRTIQISDIFRATFGDAAMGARIRPVFEWQYADANFTASTPLKFGDDYFNNGDGISHVATPHPLNYYVWGGGGATYYGAANGYGVTTQLVNSSFEAPAIANGYTQAPAGATWSFTGTAGIARDAGGGDDIPLPYDGSQMGYIAGTGSISINVTIPATQNSDRYAFVFKALQRVTTGGVTNAQKLRLFINEIESNWESFNQTGDYKPTVYNATYPWSALVVYWTSGTPYYSSVTFTAVPCSTVTLRLEGTTNESEIAFIEDVQLCSVDKIFADGMPGGGEANGQPVGSAYQATLDTESSWALAYGLNSVSYEGGWSLGG
ncbi:MAG: PA14 domain-containing protein, partial [Verrucomicrobia bacterium]|nr:PA14 domain-containing protein [Verrucomicrobiota bacterium]